MINKVILMGRLCADPELRNTQSGIAVCRFRIAVNRQYSKNSDQKADFINIVSWRQQAEFVNRYFRKGSMIIVEGKLQNADYTDSNGVKHYAMDVQADNVTFGESKTAQNAAQSDYNSQPQNYQPTPQTAYREPQTPLTAIQCRTLSISRKALYIPMRRMSKMLVSQRRKLTSTTLATSKRFSAMGMHHSKKRGDSGCWKAVMLYCHGYFLGIGNGLMMQTQ